MLHRDIFVFHVLGNNAGFIQRLSGFPGKGHLPAGNLGQTLKLLIHHLAHHGGIYIQLLKQEGHNIFIDLRNSLE